jgi:hypothetical protein
VEDSVAIPCDPIDSDVIQSEQRLADVAFQHDGTRQDAAESVLPTGQNRFNPLSRAFRATGANGNRDGAPGRF